MDTLKGHWPTISYLIFMNNNKYGMDTSVIYLDTDIMRLLKLCYPLPGLCRVKVGRAFDLF